MLLFQLPDSYQKKSGNSPTSADYDSLNEEKVPGVVLSCLRAVLPAHVPRSEELVHVYVRVGLLPPFVVNFFMSVQRPKANISPTTRYFRALAMIESYRHNVYDTQPDVPTPTGPLMRLNSATLQRFSDAIVASRNNLHRADVFSPMPLRAAGELLADIRRLAGQPGTAGVKEDPSAPSTATKDPGSTSAPPTAPEDTGTTSAPSAAPKDTGPLDATVDLAGDDDDDDADDDDVTPAT